MHEKRRSLALIETLQYYHCCCKHTSKEEESMHGKNREIRHSQGNGIGIIINKFVGGTFDSFSFSS